MIGYIAFVGQKVGMATINDERGSFLSVTLLKVNGNIAFDSKSKARDGYNSILLCGIDTSVKSLSKPQSSIYKSKNISPKKVIKEFRVDFEPSFENPIEFQLSEDLIGSYVDVTSKSRGKGFQGAMKRWGFAGLPASHGVSVSHRSHGSTGCRTQPGKVLKGKKMAGRMGGKSITVQSLKIISIDAEEGLIAVYGSVPGYNGAEIVVKSASKVYRSDSSYINGVNMVQEKSMDVSKA